MKVHTTNYTNAFIQVAEDSPVKEGEVPPAKKEKTLANIQYEMISENPYMFTSDDVLFHCYATKNAIKKSELNKARKEFFSKGQACFRSSPLTKRYGFGVHSDEEGKIALYGAETSGYRKFSNDRKLTVVKAMRSKKAE